MIAISMTEHFCHALRTTTMKSRTALIVILSIVAYGVALFLVHTWVNPAASSTATSTSEEACVDMPSFATVWNDTNPDGIKIDGERPMSDVCVYARYSNRSDNSDEWYITQCRSHAATHSSGFTDNSGTWMSDGPMAGGCGNPKDLDKMVQDTCKGISISIVVPDGYKATTPTTVIGCEAKFGLVKKP